MQLQRFVFVRFALFFSAPQDWYGDVHKGLFRSAGRWLCRIGGGANGAINLGAAITRNGLGITGL